MEFDELTGDEIEEKQELDIVVSAYDNDGNYYMIDSNKKVFKKDEDDIITEITDKQKILQILELFKPGKTDVKGQNMEAQIDIDR